MSKEILYNYYNVLTCKCKIKDDDGNDIDVEHKNGLGNKTVDEIPPEYIAGSQDVCPTCKDKLKFKELRKITTTDEKVK